jgi:hypothetical protein
MSNTNTMDSKNMLFTSLAAVKMEYLYKVDPKSIELAKRIDDLQKILVKILIQEDKRHKATK